MNKKRLLYVICDSSNSGAPRQVALLARGLAQSYDVHLICPHGWLVDQLNDEVTVHAYNQTLSRRRLRNWIAAQYQALRPDIIHCHGVRAGILGRAGGWGSARMIYTEHLWTKDFHVTSRLRQFVQLRMLARFNRKSDHIVAVSQAVQQFLLQHQMASPSKTTVIYGAIEPIPKHTPEQKPIIGTIGHLTWVKGIGTLLAAVAMIVPKHPALICRIAGDGPDLDALKQLGQRLGISAHIEWLGLVNDPASFFQSLQIYVQPSLSESFGMAPLEAMSAAVPVIVSNAGALPEIVDTEQTGLIYQAGDADALAKQLQRLLSDSQFRATIAHAGRDAALQYSPQRLATTHDALYQKVL